MADIQAIANDLSNLTVLQVAELVKALEEKWGVSAAAAAKGRYVKSIALSSTMGPGVRVDLASVEGHA